MRSLRWVGLVFSLLIVGVLGGLMAPLPSEANPPTLTLQADNGDPVNILGASTSCPSGYNQCYRVNFSAANANGSNSRSFNVFIAPGTSSTSSKLRINDTASQDALKLTEVKFAPTSTSDWPNTESHVLRIVMTNTFNTSNGAGNYVFALRSGGYLQAGGTVSPIYTQYDFLTFTGTGTFSPTLVNVPLLNVSPATTNLTPLELQVANAVAATYFTLDQVVTYPTFACDADGSGSGTVCTPIITITMTVTLYGPDSLVLTASNDALGGGPCNLTSPDPGGGPSGNPAIPCHSSGKKKSSSSFIQTTFTANDTTDVNTAITDEPSAVRAIQCVAADNCPCANPYDPQCAGTIIHNVDVTPAIIETFPFTAVGPGINAPDVCPSCPPYTITTDSNGEGSKTFSPLPAVGEGPWIFTKGTFPLPPDANKVYDIDSISCVSTLEPTIPLVSKLDGFTTWTADSGSVKISVTVHTVKGGDTVTCGMHIHKTSNN